MLEALGNEASAVVNKEKATISQISAECKDTEGKTRGVGESTKALRTLLGV